MKVVFGFALLVASTCAFLPRAPFRSSTLLAITKTNKAPVFDEVCETTGVTLKSFMSEVALLNPDLVELTILFNAIEISCKAIANLVRRSQLPSAETLGYVQEKDQKVSCFWRSSPILPSFSFELISCLM